MPSRKPVIAWAVVIVAGLVGLGNVLTWISAVAKFGQRPTHEVVATALLSLFVAVVSALIIRGILRGSFGSRWPVSLYLWGILFLYPMCNVLRAFGWYLPAPQLSDQELVGAALFELMRYVVLIVLIIWVLSSKALKAYFKRPVPGAA